jgi:DHA2 family multidrug resistance protein
MTDEPITPEPPFQRYMITASIMLATSMMTLDSTIANVALPHMAGSVGASADQITWVLTSYIIAVAIVTPMSGWLAARLGRKRLFIIAIVGFIGASALCGAAQTLGQIVACRVLQGAFGAVITPLSQAVMLDAYPIEERGWALAVWGVGVQVAPIVGPVLGGWLTDDFSWRWVFYINLPVGTVSLLGVIAFIHDRHARQKTRLDLIGFSLLAVALAAFQLFLDRGQSLDWLQSPEIQVEMAVAGVAILLFVVHSFSVPRPFLPLGMFKDRNFLTSVSMTVAVSMLVFSVLALLPPMSETLLGYPVITTGLVSLPRGTGGLISMLVVGRVVSKVDNRLLVGLGFLVYALAYLGMSAFSLQMDPWLQLWTGALQGAGIGLVFMPLSTLTFATLPSSLRVEAAGFYSLTRNLGQSAGISIMQSLFTRNTQVVHARLSEGLRPDNPLARPPWLPASFSLSNPLGAATLEGEVGRQAAMVAYIDVFFLMFIITLGLMPMVLLLQRQPTAPQADHLPLD